jgi:membrane fusion protein
MCICLPVSRSRSHGNHPIQLVSVANKETPKLSSANDSQPSSEEVSISSESASDKTGELFRQEVLEEQGEKIFADAILIWPPSVTAVVGLYACFVAGVLIMASFGHYQRKHHVRGVIQSDPSPTEVVAMAEGMVREILVREGRSVKKGETIAVLTRAMYAVSGVDTLVEHRRQMATEEERITKERLNLEQKLKLDLHVLATRHRGLQEESTQTRAILDLKKEQANRTASLVATTQELFRKKLVTRSEVEALGSQLASLRQSIGEEERQILKIATQIRESAMEKDRVKKDYERQSLLLVSKAAELKSRLLDLDVDKDRAIKAPVSGWVTAINVDVGHTVTPSAVILTILPEVHTLKANLYLPSHVVPFVREKQPLWLQFEAFSPKKYGMIPGSVESLSKVPVKPPFNTAHNGEPDHFLATVVVNPSKLKHKGLTLKSGLLVDADILLERRRIADWLLDPWLRMRRSHDQSAH